MKVRPRSSARGSNLGIDLWRVEPDGGVERLSEDRVGGRRGTERESCRAGERPTRDEVTRLEGRLARAHGRARPRKVTGMGRASRQTDQRNWSADTVSRSARSTQPIPATPRPRGLSRDRHRRLAEVTWSQALLLPIREERAREERPVFCGLSWCGWEDSNPRPWA